ncbi:MAG: helix-turn-helix transcriptional regulator [Synergistaceae bacterium]|nr:helix-turn-helix transcriptional regulator [Synergistaceae bacterium]
MKKNYKILSDRIRALRGSRTQSEIAEILNITQAYLSEIERGKKVPSNALLLDIAKKFNTTVSYLLGETAGVELPEECLNLHESVPVGREKSLDQVDYVIIQHFSLRLLLEMCSTTPRSEATERLICVPKADVGSYFSINNAPFALTVTDGIIPAHGITANSRIIVNPEAKLLDFDVALVYYKRQLALKKIIQNDDGSIELVSTDGTKIHISLEELLAGEFKVLGKVTSVTHKPTHGL